MSKDTRYKHSFTGDSKSTKLINWTHIWLIIKIYLLVIPIFFCFRFILFLTQLDKVGHVHQDFFKIVMAFIMGIRFDVVISGYLLILPFLVISVMFIINKYNKLVLNLIFYWIFILFTLSFIICAVDIPYYKQFFSRFNTGAFQWMDHPLFVFKMIVQEPRYYLVVIPLILIVIAFFKILNRVMKLSTEDFKSKKYLLKTILTVVFLCLIFIGIRGRLQKKSPIRIGTAYFCDNAFLNQLGLNPVFTLMRSYLDGLDDRNKTINLTDEKLAISNVQKYLQITHPDPSYPIARQVIFDSLNEARYNVVVIIMESMSAAKLKRLK